MPRSVSHPIEVKRIASYCFYPDVVYHGGCVDEVVSATARLVEWQHCCPTFNAVVASGDYFGRSRKSHERRFARCLTVGGRWDALLGRCFSKRLQ